MSSARPQAPSLGANLHFSRFEFKYVLPKGLRDRIEGELQHFVELDPYVQDQPGQKYTVRSLYWDDQQLTAYHDKIDGLIHRSKFRLRTYSTDKDSEDPRFLEIKGRHDNLVFKHRIPVDIGPADAEVSGADLSDLVISRTEESEVRDRFLFKVLKRRIQPYAVIDYQRRPYISRFDPEFRLTFDEQLHSVESDRLFPRNTDRGRRIAPGYTVMELKSRRHVPSWFHRVIQAYELRRQSFSKICAGTVALGLVEDED